MDSEECSICGLELNEKYTHELSCNHKFHYECLMKTYTHTPKMNNGNHLSCPYCREKTGYLPIVNGLKKLIVGVHVGNYKEFYDENGNHKLKNKSCQHILTRGKNKGNQCSKNCFLGYDYCKTHKK
tara:strand:- start:221 stop:598 length:378 start_codon:yes stop_codon:yes gene_type:complete